MATRANILVKMANGKHAGKWASIYTHWDGYPEHHEPILHNHYNSQEKAESLIALGDLSVLDVSTECPDGHSFDNHVDGYCVAYGRDRGETDVDARYANNLLEIWPDNEYAYFWNGKVWVTVDLHREGNRNDMIAQIMAAEPIE